MPEFSSASSKRLVGGGELRRHRGEAHLEEPLLGDVDRGAEHAVDLALRVEGRADGHVEVDACPRLGVGDRRRWRSTVWPVSSARRFSAQRLVGGVGGRISSAVRPTISSAVQAEARVVDPGVAEVGVLGEDGDVRARQRLLEALVGALELVGAPGDRRSRARRWPATSARLARARSRGRGQRAAACGICGQTTMAVASAAPAVTAFSSACDAVDRRPERQEAGGLRQAGGEQTSASSVAARRASRGRSRRRRDDGDRRGDDAGRRARSARRATACSAMSAGARAAPRRAAGARRGRTGRMLVSSCSRAPGANTRTWGETVAFRRRAATGRNRNCGEGVDRS